MVSFILEKITIRKALKLINDKYFSHSHLLDILYEQEKAAYNSMSLKPKIQTTETTFEDTDDARMNRWSTEEDLSEGGALERKTKSLGDFKSGTMINNHLDALFIVNYTISN